MYKETTGIVKIHFAYYNQYKNGIDIAFADNALVYVSYVEAEKSSHCTKFSKHIDNLVFDEP